MIKTPPLLNGEDTAKTVNFIEKVKILCVKKTHGDTKKHDPLKKVISDLDDEHLLFLSNSGKRTKRMKRN